MGEVSDRMREGGGELSSVSDIVVGRTSAARPRGCGSPDGTDPTRRKSNLPKTRHTQPYADDPRVLTDIG